ncbi:16S rRNA (guanine(527)-N(7))-methyltransferase RsmG [bacterium D16-51]|nr:16S rRNA (guanine(527)-N(7))-methyltransferase RsmG [bacterium D16-59]RKI60393.1 16S rRNA (guanine(527)-N(7))-methyltransferase RsmG [bacterium D16-51]
MKNYLEESAKKAGIVLSEEKLVKFEVFYELLIETNKLFNLTAITEMHEVVLKHFVDSIMIEHCFSLGQEKEKQICPIKKIADVGTGAGFPGIPLAILYSDIEFVLMDSLKKRLNFIETVLEKANIKNVSLVHGRAEDLGQDSTYREKFDLCVSRAVASLPVLLELCTPFVRVGGKFVSYKSELLKEELGQSKSALSILHCTLERKYEYTIPDSELYRVLAIFSKEKKLEKKYPRQAGRPKKNPL